LPEAIHQWGILSVFLHVSPFTCVERFFLQIEGSTGAVARGDTFKPLPLPVVAARGDTSKPILPPVMAARGDTFKPLSPPVVAARDDISKPHPPSVVAARGVFLSEASTGVHARGDTFKPLPPVVAARGDTFKPLPPVVAARGGASMAIPVCPFSMFLLSHVLNGIFFLQFEASAGVVARGEALLAREYN
jgi:hypothetical protein